jgi:hypothetical protein
MFSIDYHGRPQVDTFIYLRRLSNWHYTGKGQSYALWRYAFLQAKIEFDFDSGEKERSAWFYDEGDGSPPKRQDFLLFDAEKRLFDRSTGEL